MSALRPLIAALLLAVSTLGCTDTSGQAAAPPDNGGAGAGDTAGDRSDHTHHAGHADEVDQTDEGAPGTTEETLARIASMDPDHLASLHDHDPAGHEHPSAHGVDHPNGVDPDRLVIPTIGVDADVIDLGLQDDGTMEVPEDFSQTGWFRPGPRPGRVGPAVIAGHVDSTRGPAVFHRLRELAPGDHVEVHGQGGEVVVFEVERLERHPKDEFPTAAVYSGTDGPELRLITCSGEFDHDARSYRDNTIVYATRTGA